MKRVLVVVVCGLAVAATLAAGSPAHAAKIRPSGRSSVGRVRGRSTPGHGSDATPTAVVKDTASVAHVVSPLRHILRSSGPAAWVTTPPCGHGGVRLDGGERIGTGTGVAGGAGHLDHDVVRRGPPRLSKASKLPTAGCAITRSLDDAAPNAPPANPSDISPCSAPRSMFSAGVEHDLFVSHSGLRYAATDRLIVARAPSSVGRPRRNLTREPSFRASAALLPRRGHRAASHSAVTATAAYQEDRSCLVG